MLYRVAFCRFILTLQVEEFRKANGENGRILLFTFIQNSNALSIFFTLYSANEFHCFLFSASIVVADGRAITSISYRSWINREARDPSLLVNVAKNSLCLFRSVLLGSTRASPICYPCKVLQ